MHIFYAKRRMDLAYLPSADKREWTILALDPRVIDLARKCGWAVLRYEDALNWDVSWRLLSQATDFARQLLRNPIWAHHRGVNLGRGLESIQLFHFPLLLTDWITRVMSGSQDDLFYVADDSVDSATMAVLAENGLNVKAREKSLYLEGKFGLKWGKTWFQIGDSLKKYMRFPQLAAARGTNEYLPVVNRLNLPARITKTVTEQADVLVNIWGRDYRDLSRTMKMLKDEGARLDIVVIDTDQRPPEFSRALEDGYHYVTLEDYYRGDPLQAYRKYQEQWRAKLPDILSWAKGKFCYDGVDLIQVVLPVLEKYSSYWFPRLALSTDAMINLVSRKAPRATLSMNVLQLENSIFCQVASQMGAHTVAARHGIGGTIPYTLLMDVAGKICVESDSVADSVAQASFSREKIAITGSLHADQVLGHAHLTREEIERKIGGKLRPYILFLPPPVSGYTVIIPSEKVNDVYQTVKQLPGYDLVVKLHYIDNPSRHDYIKDKHGFYLVQDMDVLSLMKHCVAFVAELGTEVSEALLVDIDLPIVLYDHLGLIRWLSQTGNAVDYLRDNAFAVVEKVSDLVSALKREMQERGKRRAARESFLGRLVGRADGRNWIRVGKEVLSYIGPIHS